MVTAIFKILPGTDKGLWEKEGGDDREKYITKGGQLWEKASENTVSQQTRQKYNNNIIKSFLYMDKTTKITHLSLYGIKNRATRVKWPTQ